MVPLTRAKAILVRMRVPEGFSSARFASRTDGGPRRRGARAAGLLGCPLAGCSTVLVDQEADKSAQTSPAASAVPAESPSPAPTRIGNATAAPPWLGTRVLPVGPDGFAAARQTPPELRNRSII